ncbi:MAG: glycosyltransferase family 4 protein [Bacteroidetes bacterium]|nr:glycosyltransferase family 4 protein [Bacteroidota bacterium]
MNTISICHITTAHPRYDVRIYHKYAKSLSQSGYDVSLCVADGLGNQFKEDVNFIDIGKPGNRFSRFFFLPLKMFNKVKRIKADIYHFHDPEFLLPALFLKKLGRKVIYDVHEDVPRSLTGRDWLPKWILTIIAFFFELMENFITKRLTGIITATPHIRDRFLQFNKNTIDINNYPIREEFNCDKIPFENRNDICYTGAVTEIRGIRTLMDALLRCHKDIKLHLAGKFADSEFEKEILNHKAKDNLIYYGLVERDKLNEIYNKCFAGVVTFLPYENHIHAQPNKIFEYMSAGIAVIGSDFKLWKVIIEKYHSGTCVDPDNSEEIAQVVNKYHGNKQLASSHGLNGKKIVQEKFNWEKEKQKLLSFYSEMLID